MTIGITGGTGFVGQHITRLLLQKGHDVTIFSRSRGKEEKAGARLAHWDPETGVYDAAAFAPLDAMVHLAGAGVADERWTRTRKAEIVRSRVQGTRTLVEALRRDAPSCKTLVSASAIGWYGADKPGQISFKEDAPPSPGFLGDTCRQWEAEAVRAADFLRTVILRIGIVLGREGGAYPEVTKGLRFGVKTILGSGDQMVSWIHVEDLVRMMANALDELAMQGVYNAVAPQPVKHRALMSALAKAKGGFSIPVPVPGVALRIGMGEMSTEVLKSCTVSAEKVQAAGFTFLFQNIEAAAKDLR